MTIEGAQAFIDSAARGWPTSSGDCNYGIFDAREAVLGGLGLHDCVGPGALEMGYWCHVAHTGQRPHHPLCGSVNRGRVGPTWCEAR
ncbi:GNAT family protein [Mycobacteroides abscessus]|uniref:hypothetical protein n=1 Tax=Mycobacteroides abscessus TaxID=36809 RepID=UPI00373FE0F8